MWLCEAPEARGAVYAATGPPTPYLLLLLLLLLLLTAATTLGM